jgi:hypothetical protein
MGENAADPPHGFQITEGTDGRWTVRHCPGGIGWRGRATYARLLWGSATLLLFAIGGVVLGPGGGPEYLLLAVVGLGLVVQVFVFGSVLWTVSSVTAFTFGSDELVVARSLFGYRRRKEFRRAEVRSVAQVKEGNSPYWSVVVAGSSRLKVLSLLTPDKSQWLGALLARWASVPFETLTPEKPEPTESL